MYWGARAEKRDKGSVAFLVTCRNDFEFQHRRLVLLPRNAMEKGSPLPSRYFPPFFAAPASGGSAFFGAL